VTGYDRARAGRSRLLGVEPAATRWLIAPSAIWAAAAYLGATVALFGAPLLHGGNECVCFGADESIPLWGFEWFPHAIAHGLNPFYTHLIYVPKGFDVALATVMPGAALLLAPITLAAGPLAAYNVAVIVSPALGAFFGFLLCRRITGRFWPGLFGGWLFGFSGYMLGQMTTHLHMTVVFLVPAIVHVVLRRLAGELSGRTFVGLMAICLLLQLSFSTELFASLTLFGVVALVLGYLFANARMRSQLRALLPSLIIAYAITAAIAAPFLYYALQPGGLPILPARDDNFSNALLSFVVPSRLMKVGGLHFLFTSRNFTAGIIEGGAYLGLPLLAMTILAVKRGWSRLQTRVLASFAVIAAVCSLGGYLQLERKTGIPMPWWPATHLPVLGLMIPARFSLFTSLAVALLASWWLAVSTHRLLAWALAALSVAFLWPAVDRGHWRYDKPLPALFTSARYRDVIGPHDVALLLPVGPHGYSMLWQAEAHLRFKMASGYLPPPESPNPYKQDPIYPTLALGLPVASVEDAARSFLARHGVTVAVVDPQISAARPWLRILHTLRWRSARIGGAIVLRPPMNP
jgi:hypothetical protein